MILIELNVRKQTIIPNVNREVISDSVGFLYAKINLDEEWENLKTKIVIYSNDISADILIPENMLVEIPSNFLKPDIKLKFTISGYAEDGNRILHTKEMISSVDIFPAGKFIGDAPEQYQPSLWEQAMAQINNAVDIAKEVENRANAGEFKGTPGEKGDKGDTGPQGPQGPKGEDGKDAGGDNILHFLTYEIIDKEVHITYCNSDISGNRIIPKFIDGYPVTSIDGFNHNGLTSIVIPDSVRSIGEDAFIDDGSLTSVYIPDSVTSIEHGAFAYTSITDVYYGGSEEQWELIGIFEDNEPLLNANIHFNQRPATVADVIKYVPVADQTYNPESENAQSGRAVSEALKTVNVDLSNYYTKEETDNIVGEIPTIDNWCVIANTTLTENIGSEKASQKFFEITTDINGNPLSEKNIRHLRMHFYFPKSEDAIYNTFLTWLTPNGKDVGGIQCAEDRYYSCSIDVMNEKRAYVTRPLNPSPSYSSGNLYIDIGTDKDDLFGGKDKIEYIAFITNYPNATILPVGTKIMITGW